MRFEVFNPVWVFVEFFVFGSVHEINTNREVFFARNSQDVTSTRHKNRIFCVVLFDSRFKQGNQTSVILSAPHSPTVDTHRVMNFVKNEILDRRFSLF